MVRYCKESCGDLQHTPKITKHKYVDHNYCSTCAVWFLKTDFNRFCPCCGVPLRHHAKHTGARHIDVIKKEVLV